MQTLELVLIKICEKLPCDYTLYEKGGECQKPNNKCDYCKKENSKYFCYKKTLTPCLYPI